jgi:hypothetical protein
MAGGGARPGERRGGRKKGTRNKRTLEQLEAAAASGEMLPLPYLLKIMRDENETPERRMFCAKAAAPYCHPKLAAVQHSGPDGGPVQSEVVITFDDKI